MPGIRTRLRARLLKTFRGRSREEAGRDAPRSRGWRGRRRVPGRAPGARLSSPAEPNQLLLPAAREGRLRGATAHLSLGPRQPELGLQPAVYDLLHNAAAPCLPVGKLPVAVRLTTRWSYIRMHRGRRGTFTRTHQHQAVYNNDTGGHALQDSRNARTNPAGSDGPTPLKTQRPFGVGGRATW